MGGGGSGGGGGGGDRKCSNMPLKLIVLHASRKYNPPTHLKTLATSYYSKKMIWKGDGCT